jgi:gliding motility-associated-like protein
MIKKMTLRKIIFALSGIFIVASANAQLSVGTSMTPQQLVQNVLLGGGVTVSNVTYTGYTTGTPMIGSFSNGSTTNLGLDAGVILSTGICTDIDNPVVFGMGLVYGEEMGLGGDADLEALVSTSVSSYDASVLGFDFIPLSDTVRFRYVFASEEYPEYVCSNFNDVFGFFVSGPGISGPYSNNSINIALIPNTNLPVAINSVNNGTEGSSGTGNCISLGYSSYYVDNEAINGTTIAFDGFTVVFTAWCVVQPCQQYHIKLAIADIGDGIYDSGVFLEAGSFSSTSVSLASVTTNPSIATDTTAVEGCSGNVITFTRSGSSISTAYTIPITVAGTATNGVDYVGIPITSITFPAGQSTTTLTVDPIVDALAEGMETIIISVPQVTACTAFEPKVIIHLYDPNPLNLSLMDDTTIICPQTFDLFADASGGNGQLSYLWSNNLGTNTTIQVTPFSTTTYTVTVSDVCNQDVSEEVTISMPQYNQVQISTSPDPTICSGETTTIFASATGGLGNYIFTWSNGLGEGQTMNVSPSQTTTYIVSVTDSCGIVSTENVTVNVMPVLADFTYNYSANEILNFVNASLNGDSFQWDFGDGEQSTEQNPTHIYADTGMYVVTLIVTNNIGCIDTTQKEIIVYPPFHLFVPNAFTPDDNGLNDCFAPVAVGVISTEMDIFDRWGCIMFHSEENNPRWNGRDSKNDRVQLGVYVYLLHYGTPTGLTYSSMGTVTLLR